jgi:peptidoglycan/LPS O-acetylase OafA/YrhL
MKRTAFLIVLAAALLGVIVVANVVSDEVSWQSSDYLIAALMLAFLIGGIEAIARLVKHRFKRGLLILFLLTIFFLIYIELAVGIFGSPLAGS